MAGDMSRAKDWIYVVCTVFQTALAFVGLLFVSFWWDRRKTKDERKRVDKQRREEERQKEIQREENRQKADAEKIAAILSENYYDVEDIFHELKKGVDKLREKKIVDDLTEFHVLQYMCRRENWKKFGHNIIDLNRLISDPPAYLAYRKELERKDPRNEILSDVERIMRFFVDFRINLFSIVQNKACPDDIKEEFSNNITRMGTTIYPFVGKHRQDVIERVLKYFVDAAPILNPATSHAIRAVHNVQEHATSQDQITKIRSIPGVSRCFGRQDTDASEVETTRLTHGSSNEVLEMASTSIRSDLNLLPELVQYPGNTLLESAIPYLECFSYEGQGCMKITFYNMHLEIYELMLLVEFGGLQEKENDEILGKIDELWQLIGHNPTGAGSLLHSIRMLMFKLSKDINFFKQHESPINEFKQYIRNILGARRQKRSSVQECERMLNDIDMVTKLCRSNRPLLILTETRDMLATIVRILNEFMAQKIQLEQQAKQQLLQQHEESQEPIY